MTEKRPIPENREPTPPLVSILVPTCNGARHLREALASIFAQTYRNIEIILLDDASTDDTAAIAAEYAGRLTYVRQPANLGQFDNVNVGIAQARGDLISIYHADDIYLPTIVAAEGVLMYESAPADRPVFIASGVEGRLDWRGYQRRVNDRANLTSIVCWVVNLDQEVSRWMPN